MNWSILLEKLNAKPMGGFFMDINSDSPSILDKKLPVDGVHFEDIASSSWAGTPAEDPFGISSPSYQRAEFKLDADEDLENDNKLFDYLDWYWRNQGKRHLIVKPTNDPPNYNRDAFFANVHATLASNCTPKMYDGLRDPKTYALESPRQYNKTVQVQNYQQNIQSPRNRFAQVTVRNATPFDPNFPYGQNYVDRRMHAQSPDLSVQHKTENWFRQRKFLEKDHFTSPTQFIDFEVPYNLEPVVNRCSLSPINEETQDRYKYKNYYRQSPTATSRSDSNLMTPKRRAFRQKESAY